MRLDGGCEILTQDNYVKANLVSMGWRFGHVYGGHLAGERVMHVLANRVRAGWGSWLTVIDKVPFYMAENSMPELEHPSVWEPGFVKLLHAVEGIYGGSVPDPTNGALYWGDLNKIERPWFKDLISAVNPVIPEDGSGVQLRQHKRVADLNSLSFWA